MSRKPRRLNVLLTLLLALLTSLVLSAGTRPQEDSLPSLQAIKSLQYAKATNNNGGGALNYSELLDLINACKAYSKSVEILPRFHEPIPTRGESGISVFKKVSPSVVMVVTANLRTTRLQIPPRNWRHHRPCGLRLNELARNPWI